MSQPMNLVVYLARAGVGSRRTCDELVRDGAVTVNGEVVTFPRQKVAEDDVVAVRGEPVEAHDHRRIQRPNAANRNVRVRRAQASNAREFVLRVELARGDDSIMNGGGAEGEERRSDDEGEHRKASVTVNGHERGGRHAARFAHHARELSRREVVHALGDENDVVGACI